MSESLLTEARALRSLMEVMNWALAKTPPAQPCDVVAQDEYTHDVVIGFDEGVFLVFDTT